MPQLPATQVKLMPGDIPGVPIEKSPLFLYNTEDAGMNNMPLHIPHTHTYNENLVYFSTDPHDPHNLGATISFYAFDRKTRRMVAENSSKPFITALPRSGWLHTPMVRRNMQRKLGFIWYITDYDPRTFEKGPRYAVSSQVHNEYYTNKRFNVTAYGVPKEDQPPDAEGDGGFMSKIEPHLGWSCTNCHGKDDIPALR